MKKNSFTLVEVIVAAVILALVITGMFAIFKSGERFSVEDRMKTQAVNISRQALEILREEASTRSGYDGLQSGNAASLPGIQDSLYESLKDTQHFSRSFRYSIDPIIDDGKEVAKKITVTYGWSFWKEGAEERDRVELSAIVSNPALGPDPVTYPVR